VPPLYLFETPALVYVEVRVLWGLLIDYLQAQHCCCPFDAHGPVSVRMPFLFHNLDLVCGALGRVWSLLMSRPRHVGYCCPDAAGLVFLPGLFAFQS
jgi:hypothetical protein